MLHSPMVRLTELMRDEDLDEQALGTKALHERQPSLPFLGFLPFSACHFPPATCPVQEREL